MKTITRNLLPLALASGLSSPANAAVIMPDSSRLIWNYTLVSTGFGSNARDSFAVTLGEDRLGLDEILLITVTATDHTTPTYTKTVIGSEVGYFAILYDGNLDLVFPSTTGSVAIEILQGSVDVRRITIILNSPTSRFTANFSEPTHLVPEARMPVMLMAAAFGLLRRSRATPS